MSETLRLAVLDLGGTSFHLLVADVTRDGELRRVFRKRHGLRLGRWLARGERIPSRVLAEAAEHARDLEQAAQRAGARGLIAVGTAPFRDSINAESLASAIRKAIESPLAVLSEEEEARAILHAVHAKLPRIARSSVCLDMGGGTLIVARSRDAEHLWSRALPLGAVRLVEELELEERVSRSEQQAVRAHVARTLASSCPPLGSPRPKHVVATGGSVRALLRIEAQRRRKLQPETTLGELDVECLAGWAELLCELSQRDRKRVPGMRLHRADLLPGAALVLDEVVRRLGFESLHVCAWGLREGVLIQAARELS